MAWGLNLADLKQFAWNSIQYSSISNDRKILGFKKWEIEWNAFIDYSYNLTCHLKFPNEKMNISHILPTYGPINKKINITIYGYGFEIAICKTVICKFNEKKTNGIFVDLNEIICPTPFDNKNLSTVSISLIIGNKTLVQSNMNYTFISSSSSPKTDKLKLIIFLLVSVFNLYFSE